MADKVVDQDQTEYAKDMFETAEEWDNILYEVTSKLDEAKIWWVKLCQYFLN